MKPITLAAILCVLTVLGKAQSTYKISFGSDTSFTRTKTGNYVLQVYLNASLGNLRNLNNYKVMVSTDLNRTTLTRQNTELMRQTSILMN